MDEQATDMLDEVGRLIALAERCASEGQMNLNKTLEAIAYAQVRRAAWNHRPQITARTMNSELAQCLKFVRETASSPELIDVLETGQQALEGGRGGDLLIGEAPDVFVCRTCGYAVLEPAPANCPDCGAWPGSFRKFVAFFNRDNAEPDDPRAILDLLQKNADDAERLAGPLSEEQLSVAPSENEWSIREHLAHFYDTQVMLDTRVDLMLEHDNPDLVALAVYEFASDADRHPDSAHEILSAFVYKRTRCVERLSALPLADLWRPGRHPEFGRLTILRQAAYLAFHEVSHLSEIEALCAETAEHS
jgi:predicted Zn-ribbon and HTH transcriptional regulator